MNEFEELLRNAKQGETEPLGRKVSRGDGRYSEDLYQELSLVFLKCIGGFNLDIF